MSSSLPGDCSQSASLCALARKGANCWSQTSGRGRREDGILSMAGSELKGWETVRAPGVKRALPQPLSPGIRFSHIGHV